MAVTTVTATELTAEQVASVLTRPLEAQSTFLASGPRIYDTAGPFRIPSAPPFGGVAIPWTGESTLIPELDPGFGEVSLLPSTMKSLKVITRYSNELARQSVVSLEAALRDRLVRDVAGRLDLQFYSATGDGITTPQGMFAWTGVQTTAVAGPLTVDVLLAAQGLALSANVNMAALRLFVTPEDFMGLRSIKDNDERYLLQPDATAGSVGSILGMGVTISSAVPTAHAAIADMSQIAVARDLAPSVTVLSERYADYDEQAIRVVARYDVKPVNPEAVVTLTGLTAVTGFEARSDKPADQITDDPEAEQSAAAADTKSTKSAGDDKGKRA